MAKPGYEHFTACDTASDDVCLIAFTSGTTGEPKGTMHFHRDMLATCDSYGRHVLRAQATDRFIGSPPLAFTFGLGGLVLFPLRVGAATILLERAGPDDLLAAAAQFGATVCFTAPTAYRAMLAKLAEHDISSLRKCVSAGETLPQATFDAWHAATGIKILDGIGATEMLHIFIGSPEDEIRPGATGRPVPGYEARVVDADGNEVPPNTLGRLAVRGPTGCRYLADNRQRVYVRDGWNITGDTYLMDADGYFWYQARSDDMIVSAGYNIAGPEVETALLTHPAVAECGVVGAPDAERGQIVKAYVVLRPGHSGDAALDQAAAGLRQGQDRALQISPRHRIRRRIAAHRRPASCSASSFAACGRSRLAPARLVKAASGKGNNVSERSTRQDRDALHAMLQPPGWPRPKGFANGIARARRNGVRRRHDRTGRAGPLRARLRGADEARAREHRGGAQGGAARRRSTSCG